VDNFKKYFVAAALAGSLYLGAAQNSFGQNLVTNGLFNTISNPLGGEIETTQDSSQIVTVSGWTNTGYTFVFPSAATNPAQNVGDQGVVSFYSQTPSNPRDFYLRGPLNVTTTGPGGTADPTNNGLDAPPAGNTIAADGAYEVGPLYETVNGLTSGKKYVLTFYYAGAQQYGASYNSATHESFSVLLSASSLNTVFTAGSMDQSGTLAGSQTTTNQPNVAHGFTGWKFAAFTFTANASSETLYFLANGTPTGQPPFSLLADVALVPVPEPKTTAAWSLLFVMLIMAGNWVRRWFQKSSATTA